MADETLSFKQMCAKFDVTPRTLRYYEYIELLQPAREGRNRIYSAREVARMGLDPARTTLWILAGRNPAVAVAARRKRRPRPDNVLAGCR